MPPFNLRILASAALLILATGFSASGDESAEEFTTARGTTLQLPQIGALECDDMELVLSRIDATRYRENAPTPHDASDRPLYEYELKLARAHFNRCVTKRKPSANGIRMFRQTSEP